MECETIEKTTVEISAADMFSLIKTGCTEDDNVQIVLPDRELFEFYDLVTGMVPDDS